ncbi:MAG TPA: response regulator [Candidatus Limiplasma pullicola]|nr:response regulator [Candidatus Limiplasma pullicola]
MLRVFIVEDEEMIRKGLVHTINWSDMGCMVVGSAADGRSGLNSILQKRPDVVITDIRMPVMDGLEMLERALATYSFRIILLTSYADFDYARRAIALRACDYLLKPLDEDKLASLISRIHSEEETAKQVRRLMPLLNGTCKSASLALEDIREQDAYVDVALKRIVSHSEQRLCIEGLAEEMGISASYLSRRFKAVTGQTFLDTLNMQRVQQAVALLHEGSRTSEVAEKTGFTDYKHFCSVFKRCTGLTPREYLRGCTCPAPAPTDDLQKG